MYSIFPLWLKSSFPLCGLCQAWADREHGAGRGTVPLGVQGGRSPQGGSCYPSSRGREHSPNRIHHHRPCGELCEHWPLWSFLLSGCKRSCIHVQCWYLNTLISVKLSHAGVQHRHRDVVRGSLGPLRWRWYSAGVCEDWSLRQDVPEEKWLVSVLVTLGLLILY